MTRSQAQGTENEAWPAEPVHDRGTSAVRAGFWRRFFASLLDGIVIGIVLVLLYLLLGTGGYVLGLLAGLAYFTYFEGGRGQTPGKMALGIRVVSLEHGGSIGYGKACLRYVVSILSGIVIDIGYLWMLWDSEKQTWHDKASGAIVVPVDR